jgi:phosphatidyl-myo-inositol dimannoside synthase
MLLRSGSGSRKREERLLRTLASDLDIDDKVKFVTKNLGRDHLAEAIKAFDVIALPFKFVMNEPPITALEAMALAKPLIVTRVSGLPELVRDNAFLVDPRNDRDLARIIDYIANNLEEATLRGRNAREYVLNLPDWNDCAKHVLALFESIRS